MNEKTIVWNYILQALNEKFWNKEIRQIPVFLKPLEKDHLGDFRFTPEGFNSIILSTNSGLTEIEMVGVLLHEMTHQLVFQKYGPNVPAHGKEWKREIKKIGFRENGLDGVSFCSKDLFNEIIERHNQLIEKYGINS
tara:strand:+ start:804 stop:1214 length:411 start_codon:yes stop_codon:yes gene_type:complete